jgi:hypothetical protein
MIVATATEAINALGGTNHVADIFGISYRVVSNWHTRGLPPDTYYVMAPRLTALGCTFSPLLFAQKLGRTRSRRQRQRGLPSASPTP